MLILKYPSTMMAFTLSVIILTFIISLFLNPTVYFYNRKKKSIAGLLFRIISATDFVICLYWPAMILYYAATLDLEKMGCSPKQIQTCNSEVRSVNRVTGIISITLTAVVLMATALLAIVRSIQIANPFYQLRKSRVWIVLASLIAIQVGVWIFAMCSPFGSKTFKIENLTFNTTHPFGTTEKVKWINGVSSFIQFIPLFLAQSCAVVASTLTAVTLLKQRYRVAQLNVTKSRSASALKAMLTNLPSLFQVIILLSFIWTLKFRNGNSPYKMSGWIPFWATNIWPLLSSIWNPVVFIALTPKSRENFLHAFTRIRRLGVREQSNR